MSFGRKGLTPAASARAAAAGPAPSGKALAGEADPGTAATGPDQADRPAAPADLAAIFARLIATHGPISLQQYMGEANARYYASRDPLGVTGDFITAPEISQVFGELVGLWLADLWLRAGRPQPVHYVELGPGRGTLARDALRAMARFGLAPAVHFVETSLTLKALQLEAVPQARWHDDLASLPHEGALLVVANEFLDALPVRQLVRSWEGWRERMVDWTGEAFVPVAGDRPMEAALPEDRRIAPVGTIIESCPGAAAVVFELAGRLVVQGGAALVIDYGYDELRQGSTLQAVRGHAKVDPFAAPGEADLTALVDFATLRAVAESRACRCLGTVEQGAWLNALGGPARARALAQASPDQAHAILSGYTRLVDPEQMGRLFKVMGLAAPHWPEGEGFTAA
ncbi:class I SAM-dependent methyltransferase [Novosphingobium piscinae]|uniref:SAM-dependent methyltransferase n=1 Tax=Novosphingobium piscinae TaxID=1507448 RepID=A0A7X1G2C6_9SPHN|nr:SAM-dependent methyltransferase [Novosphingobium piscinae]MBC2670627.1 SAM-dependent methyltransferase [Novosphingobium piscinae]